MKKTSVQVSYDSEKLSALELYLSQAGKTLEDELRNSLDKLYTKTVPLHVRRFFALRDGDVTPEKKQTESRENKSVRRSTETGDSPMSGETGNGADFPPKKSLLETGFFPSE